jgi:hypothetical protein
MGFEGAEREWPELDGKKRFTASLSGFFRQKARQNKEGIIVGFFVVCKKNSHYIWDF